MKIQEIEFISLAILFFLGLFIFININKVIGSCIVYLVVLLFIILLITKKYRGDFIK